MYKAAFKISLIYSKLQGQLQPSVLPAKQTNSMVSHKYYRKEFWARHPKLLCYPGKQKQGQGLGAGTTKPREGLIPRLCWCWLCSRRARGEPSDSFSSAQARWDHRAPRPLVLLFYSCSDAGNCVTAILVSMDQNVTTFQLLKWIADPKFSLLVQVRYGCLPRAPQKCDYYLAIHLFLTHVHSASVKSQVSCNVSIH